jgi:ankyrin repeat protein
MSPAGVLLVVLGLLAACTSGTTPAGDEAPRTKQQQADLDRRLIRAAWDDDVARARRLIARGADVNTQDDTKQSAYLISTSEGYYELLELTLRHGAQVEAKDSFNGTGVIRAAERGHWDVVGRLVRAGVPVDHVNNLGWTGLHEAIILGDGTQRYVATVRVLVAAGADVTIPSVKDGVTPVKHARSRGFEEIADLLDAAEAADRERIGRAAADRRLLEAAADGDADGVALALRSGARIETRDERERTPLLLASTYDRVEVARVLVALGADPDALDDRHDTPWLVTGVTGSVPMLEVLLPAHPNLTIRNRYGGVSVIPASERGHVAYVRRVVSTGIDVNHVNDLGWTALLEAVILGDGSRPYQQIVRTLLAAGADPDIADRDGRSALAHAEAGGQQALAAILRRRD